MFWKSHQLRWDSNPRPRVHNTDALPSISSTEEITRLSTTHPNNGIDKICRNPCDATVFRGCDPRGHFIEKTKNDFVDILVGGRRRNRQKTDRSLILQSFKSKLFQQISGLYRFWFVLEGDTNKHTRHMGKYRNILHASRGLENSDLDKQWQSAKTPNQTELGNQNKKLKSKIWRTVHVYLPDHLITNLVTQN